MPGLTRPCARPGCAGRAPGPAFLCQGCIAYVSTATLCRLRRAYHSLDWAAIDAAQTDAVAEATDALTEQSAAAALLGGPGQP